jgi:hypothetical protein
MFLQPGIDVPGLKRAAEGIKYGTIMDPFKNIDPKQQGRVKTRILELHGPGSAGFIPDSDIPWSQNERENSFGGQKEMSTFGLPQKNSVIKARHHGDSKYSPLYSGALYGALTKISQWTGKGKDSGDGFNQKDHYGHKDPLGNVEHSDMKSKTKTIDWTQFSEVIFNLPKTTFNVKNTNHNRNQGTFEDGSPSQIQGMPGGGGGASTAHTAQFDAGSGSTTPVDGDVIWNVDGKHDSTIQKAVTENYKSTHTSNVQSAVTFNHNSTHTDNFGDTFTRTVGGSGLERGGGAGFTQITKQGDRSDTYALSWASQAKNTAWSWLTSRNILGG